MKCSCGKEYEITEVKVLKKTVNRTTEEKSIEGTIIIDAQITGATEKGLKLLYNGVDDWVPKSAIKNDYEQIEGKTVRLIIMKWPLKKFGVTD